MKNKKIYTVGGLFSGVGGIEQGFINNGFEVLWSNDIDEPSSRTFKLNFHHRHILQDIHLKIHNYILTFLFVLSSLISNAQDTAINVDNGQFTLSDAIVRNNFDYKTVLQRIKEDTSFYKAFKTLRTIGYSSYNHIEMKDKNGKLKEDNQGQGVVYGKLDIGEGDEDGLMQTKSADAVKGYGPLLYQAAMYYFEPKY